MEMISKKHSFNIMIAGRCGIGKSTFINTLFNTRICTQSQNINLYVLDIEIEGLLKTITAIDTPGLGFNMNDTILHTQLNNFIKLQFDKYLTQETKIKRVKNYEDSRVHCLLYFIKNTGLLESDILFLKSVCDLVNVVLCIGKSECLDSLERQSVKKNVRTVVEKENIRLFENTGINKQRLDEMWPFLLMGSEDVTNKKRVYRWGTVSIEDTKASDVQIIKELLFTNADVFVETTDNDIYERYRTQVLTDMLAKEPV